MSSALSFIPIFETKSHRVKGVAFHPTRPWVLSSLHNGVIQLWDYRIRTLVDRFGEHDGPVRTVDFHHTQPLFVSGGDDYKIKVWNYKERRCLFTLLGHLDYIRTVQFHHEYPWILSASDDQTIRIWNWQSRQCQAVLTGHSHYVMCARFHPSEDLVVSASLDQTVRVWDISGLRKKNVTPLQKEDMMASKLQNDLFGNTDAIVKFVLEGHDRGVNWAAFHPSSPVIVSGADARPPEIKLWRMSDTKAWELDTLRGHYNNVCCVIFHPREDIILSNSEDKTIRVWDMAKRTCIYTYRRDHDRFWMLAAHPKLNLFCAAHDSGLVVFKLHHDRPAYQQHKNEVLFYVKDRAVFSYHFDSGRDVLLVPLRKGGGGGGGNSSSAISGLDPRTLAYNGRENCILVTYFTDSGDRYELISLPKDGKEPDSGKGTSRGGAGKAAIWIKHNRFAFLDKSNVIHIKDLANETTKKLTPPYSIDNMFAAATDLILIRSEDKIALYDVVQEKPTAYELKLAHVKDAVWSKSSPPLVAFICRTGVVIATNKLEILLTIPETMKVKSGVWDENGTFIYSTLSHIKYAIPNGDHGIIRTLDRPVYITAAKGSNLIICLDRAGKCHRVTIDSTEFMFKHALANKRFDQVLRMVQNSNLIGQSIIGYLQSQGYPEVALHFVKDEKTRFNLALQCTHMNNNIEIARVSAQALDDKECWTKLGVEALRQGNHQVVEKAYQQTLDFERLSFLYLITGNKKNLRKMLDIATNKRKDVNARFQNALLLGNVEERIAILEEQGLYPLAYMCAKTHGLEAHAARIQDKLKQEATPTEDGEEPEEFPPRKLTSINEFSPTLLVPPVPIFRLDKSNWPMTRMSRGLFDQQLEGLKPSGTPLAAGVESALKDEAPPSGWGDDNLGLSDDEEGTKNKPENDEKKDEDVRTNDNGSGWGDDNIEGIDLEDEPPAGPAQTSRSKTTFITLPPPGRSKPEVWSRKSVLAADLIAGGLFEDAMRLLNRQIGAVNFEPLKHHFLRIFQSSSVQLIGMSSLPPMMTFLERTSSGGESEDSENSGSSATQLPKQVLTLQSQIDALSNAYRAFTKGPQAFEEAKNLFEAILAALPLVVVQARTEANEIKEFIGICREYLLGITTELKRKELGEEGEKDNPKRILELCAYFTHCDLQPKHLQLILKSSMNTAARLKSFKLADHLARHLLDLNPPEDFVTHTRKVLRLCEQKGKADTVEINYDPRNPFVLCCQTLTPIYQGSPAINCPYCGSSAKPEFSGKLCPVCHISQLGRSAEGIVSIEGANVQKGGSSSKRR